MREIFTSGSVGGLVEQSPSLPGQPSRYRPQRHGRLSCRGRLNMVVRHETIKLKEHWRAVCRGIATLLLLAGVVGGYWWFYNGEEKGTGVVSWSVSRGRV
jgi:hypothetical protein